MRILVYDIDCSSSGVKYPFKTALEGLGHIVYMFDWGEKIGKIENRYLNKLLKSIDFYFIKHRINHSLINVLEKNDFDLFIVMRGDFLTRETLEFAKKKIKYLVNWNTDDLFNKKVSKNVILDTIPIYDIHFSPRYSLKDDYLSFGAKRFELLNWYYRFGINYDKYALPRSKFLFDSTFIGAWSIRRENILSVLNDKKLKINGWGWNEKAVNISNNWSVSGNLGIVEMSDIFYNSKINLNILTIENRDENNLRNFEIAATGGFQLSEKSDSIISLFEENKEIVCFESNEELLSKYEFYLNNDSAREKVAINSQKKIFNTNNSLSDRLQEILNYFN